MSIIETGVPLEHTKYELCMWHCSEVINETRFMIPFGQLERLVQWLRPSHLPQEFEVRGGASVRQLLTKQQ
jgi:hypothetical protein